MASVEKHGGINYSSMGKGSNDVFYRSSKKQFPDFDGVSVNGTFPRGFLLGEIIYSHVTYLVILDFVSRTNCVCKVV